jgi:hypothetical protein
MATLYASMLPFEYTNNDVAKVFERFGEIAKCVLALTRGRVVGATADGERVRVVQSHDSARSCVA